MTIHLRRAVQLLAMPRIPALPPGASYVRKWPGLYQIAYPITEDVVFDIWIERRKETMDWEEVGSLAWFYDVHIARRDDLIADPHGPSSVPLPSYLTRQRWYSEDGFSSMESALRDAIYNLDNELPRIREAIEKYGLEA
jgi:hypothetical protein